MIDFSGYTREAIQKDMLSQVSKDIDTREGSMIQTAVGPAAWYLEGFYLLLDQIQQNAYASTAVGQALDYKCAERGISRKPAVSAKRRGIFDAEIPEGALFRALNGINSVLFRAGKFLEKADSCVYELICETPGLAGNAYTGSLLPVTAIPGLTLAQIGEIILAGSEEEDDESLRARYFATFDTSAFGGNIIAYRTAILAIPGVGAVQVYPTWKGGGTVLCSILSGMFLPADQGTIDKVQEIICPEEDDGSGPTANGFGMAPIGAAVTITTASERILDIECTIQILDGIDTELDTFVYQISQQIENYLDSIRKDWGMPAKGQKIDYSVSVYLARISAEILKIPEIVNVTDMTINGEAKDVFLTETAWLQEVPVLGEVKVHE